MLINKRRVVSSRPGGERKGPVLYWMSRDQRSRDNWALLFAQELALNSRVPLVVLFCLAPRFLGAAARQYDFMITGLREVEEDLWKKDIPFVLLQGLPEEEIPAAVRSFGAGAVVTDFDPLRIKREWQDSVSERLDLPFHVVDAHNVVPCPIASQKREYGAYTLRPKIRRSLPEFLTDFPPVKRHPYAWGKALTRTDWDDVMREIHADMTVPPVRWLIPGEAAGRRALRGFIAGRLKSYAEGRNDPLKGGQSDLSPYLHFGQIAPQRVAIEVLRSAAPRKERDAFIEELVVRRELSDNFCLHTPAYDRVGGFPDWARKTLDSHRDDRREYSYPIGTFERGLTHDPLWNAAQTEMVRKGKMHGYLRMYWAKKILEWTASPEDALDFAIRLNDRYELDGRDPNGYAGLAWSIGGVHDRAWGERPVFGKIRYMSAKGCRSKFDVDGYIDAVGRMSMG